MASRTKTKERRRLKPRHQSRGQVDTPFLLLTILLVIIGLVMLLSASYPTAWYDVQNRTGQANFQYVCDVMDTLTAIRSQWGMVYPFE